MFALFAAITNNEIALLFAVLVFCIAAGLLFTVQHLTRIVVAAGLVSVGLASFALAFVINP